MIVYKATNQINGKVYIGQTVKSLNTRMSQHKHNAHNMKKQGNHFYSAIRKYGWEAFTWEVIEECNSIHEMNQAEVRWIAYYKANDREFGYNKSTGGEHSSLGVVKSQEQKRKIAKTLRKDSKVQPRDYNKKGEAQIGERNSKSKLTVEDVAEIKTFLYFSDLTYGEIGKLYGVKASTIGKINRGERWSWLSIIIKNGGDANAIHKIDC